MTSQKSTQPAQDGSASLPATTTPPAYVVGAHAALVRARNDRDRITLMARAEVVQAARREADDELADIATTLLLLSEPPELQSNVTTLVRTA